LLYFLKFCFGFHCFCFFFPFFSGSSFRRQLRLEGIEIDVGAQFNRLHMTVLPQPVPLTVRGDHTAGATFIATDVRPCDGGSTELESFPSAPQGPFLCALALGGAEGAVLAGGGIVHVGRITVRTPSWENLS
jgi:hypothetical protein